MILQDETRYIVVTKHRVLCAKGWRLKSNLSSCQIKLFPKPSHVKSYFENTANYIRPKYSIQKVKIRIEVLDDGISEQLEDNNW